MNRKDRGEANSFFFWGGYRWQLERALYYEMAVVYGVFCGMCARTLMSYTRRRGREGERGISKEDRYWEMVEGRLI